LNIFDKTEVVKCPYCKDPFKNNETTIQCDSCNAIYHLECFKNGCLVYGCKAGTKHFLVKWNELTDLKLPQTRILNTKSLADLVATGVKIKEKTELRDPVFDGKWWVVRPYQTKAQVLSTFGLLRVIAKYGDVEYWRGPYNLREEADEYLYDYLYRHVMDGKDL
jgi:hypothetical protein